MERRKNTNWIEPQVDLDNEGGRVEIAISELMSFPADSETRGATHIVFTGESEYESYCTLESLEIQPVRITSESDDEYEKRTALENHRHNLRLEAAEKREIAEYNRLRLKYEKEMCNETQ